MVNAHSFPFLRLPFLASKHVITVMDVREQYLFSTISKQSKRIAKYGTCLVSYAYEVELHRDVTIVIIRKDWSSELFRIFVVPKPIDQENDSSHFASDCIFLEAEDFREKSIKILTFLGEIFKSSNCEIECRKVPNEFSKRILTTVKDLKIQINNLEIDGDGRDNQMYEWIMQNCRDAKRLINRCKTTPDFKWDSELPFTFESCLLQNAPFLRIDHLTRLFWNCRIFETDDDRHSVTNEDLNQLVKMMMKGDSKLEYLQMSRNSSIKFQEVMTDIEKMPVERAYLKNVPHHFNPGIAFRIRQHNGTEAVVCLTSIRSFIITTQFEERTEDFTSDDEGEW